MFAHYDGRGFTPDAFDDFCRTLQLSTWRPSFVVLHNTGVPTIAERPHGYNAQTMINLRDYYVGLGWSGGPHLIVDQTEIHVLNNLHFPGVHSPHWNHQSWGVEMLGNYSLDDFKSGPGAQIAANAVRALAALHSATGMDSHTLRLHHEDPDTTHHDCPGKGVDKARMIMRVHSRVLELHPGGH